MTLETTSEHGSDTVRQITSGFVAILGRPNVGKSTLINHLVGEKIAITTPKPQTTRDRIIGVYHGDDMQIAFVDTPGYHDAKKKQLNRYMVTEALTAISDVDAVVVMVDAISKRDELKLKYGAISLIKRATEMKKPVVIALNKVDALKDKPQLLPMIENFAALEGVVAVVPLSAVNGVGVDALLSELAKLLPQGPAFYPDSMVTDRPEKWQAAELIRETCMMQFGQEVPYSMAVHVERFSEKKSGIYIDAFLYVERDSQKAIVLGKRVP